MSTHWALMAGLAVLWAGGIATTASAAPQSSIPVAVVQAAVHRGQVMPDAVRWTSTVRLGLRGVANHRELRMEMAVREGVALDVARLPAGVVPERVNGRLTALRIESQRVISAPLLELEFVQHTPVTAGAARLEPPVLWGTAPQLVVLAGREGITFLPDVGLGVVQRLGFSAPQDLRASQRRKLMSQLGQKVIPPSGAAVWLRPSEVRGVGAITGTLSMTAQRRARAGVWLGFGSVLGVILLWVTLRGLEPIVEVEDADAVLRDEFSCLGN